MVSNTGTPLICDFGISRLIAITTSLGLYAHTESGTPKGTCRWMSPELLLPPVGQSASHTKESDIWAFGMIVYVSYSVLHVDHYM